MGPSWPWSHGSWIYNYLCNQCLSPLMLRVRILIRARCTTLCDKVCQWLATGLWFSPGPPVSSTNKTDRLDITEILLKVALNIIKQTNILKLIEPPGIHNVVKPLCHTTCLWFDARQWYAPGSRYTATIKTHHQTIVEIIEYSDMATRTTASNR